MSDSKLMFKEGDLIPIQLEVIEVDHDDDVRPYRVRIKKEDTYHNYELFDLYWLPESELLSCNIDPEYLKTAQAKRNKERLAALMEQRNDLEAEIEALQEMVDAESEES